MYEPIVDEIALLLDKISASEAFLDKAEEYFRTHKHLWSDGVIAYFEIFMERKREQVYFEQNLVEQMGWRAALEPEVPGPDI